MIEVNVCVGTNCTFKGSLDILEYLENDSSLQGKITLKEINCLDKACKTHGAPVVVIGEIVHYAVNLGKVLSIIQEELNGK